MVLIQLYSCTIKYSFTGADIPPEAKTVSVDFVENRAPIVNPTLSPAFTEALRDIMIAQTNLDLVDEDGDLQYEGNIVGYDVAPVAITGEETAALNRLTIRVSIKYINTLDEEKNAESQYSAFYDYPSTQDLTAVESAAIEDINARLVQDVFNKTLGNW